VAEHEDQFDLEKKRELAVALKRMQVMELKKCFDPYNPKSRPTRKQRGVLKEFGKYSYQYIQAGNQTGKSQIGGRVVSWLYKRDHPYFDVEKAWPNEPILIIVCGRTSRQVEELWDKKIKPFLMPNEYREQRMGSMLASVTNPINESKIIFATHHNANEARAKVQSYVANFFWFDELTDYLPLIEEAQRRVQAKQGVFMMTYTPKLRAPMVKEYIESPNPNAKIYKMSMLDNPIYKDRQQEMMDNVAGLSEDYRNSVLFGSWYVGENSVYGFDMKKHVEDIQYSQEWPHIVAVDPAASGLMGYTLWAAPYSNAQVWYCVDCEYLKGRAPSDMIELVENRVSKFSVIKRIVDPHEAWFIKEAWKQKKVNYLGVPRKNHRKKELITQLNEALGVRVRIMPNCRELIDELSSCQWSESVPDKIINAHQFHLADCAQYFVDMMPPFKETGEIAITHDEYLRRANKERLVKEWEKEHNPQTRRGGPRYMLVAKRGRKWRRR
jgi:hypothetical protein